MSVWILVGYFWASYAGGGPFVLDNIATQQEWMRIAEEVAKAMPHTSRGGLRCVEVRKAR